MRGWDDVGINPRKRECMIQIQETGSATLGFTMHQHGAPPIITYVRSKGKRENADAGKLVLKEYLEELSRRSI